MAYLVRRGSALTLDSLTFTLTAFYQDLYVYICAYANGKQRILIVISVEMAAQNVPAQNIPDNHGHPLQNTVFRPNEIFIEFEFEHASKEPD